MAVSKVILNGTTLIDTTDKTVTAESMLNGVTALKNDGTTATGSIASKSSTDLTVSGATVTAPAGYYPDAASKSVLTTTHPSPTASIDITTGIVTAKHVQTFGFVSAGTTTSTLTLSTQAAKTVTPTESEQTAVEAHKYTTGDVKVGAISSTYVGTDITRRSSSDITASGATVTVPSGYYSAQASKSVAWGTEGVPIATKGTVSNNKVSVTPSVTNTGGYIHGLTKTGTSVTVSASELVSGIKSITENANGIDITNYASVDVNVTPNIKSLTVTPSVQDQVFNGGMEKGSLKESFGFSSSGTKNMSEALTDGKDYHVTIKTSTNGGYNLITRYDDAFTVSSQLESVGAADVSISTTQVVMSSNYYDYVSVDIYNINQIDGYLPVTVYAMPSGSTGTPTATKGTVSNHSVSITPSVTNTTGYITGGTQTGTAVTVSASELVSGTKSISAAGETDVTNYEKVSVSNGSATTPATTITANPTISVSSAGLITASVSGSQNVTPNVSTGYVSSGTAGTVSVSGSKTQQLTAKAATTYYPSTTDQTIASGQYLTGTQTIKAVTTTNLIAENIAEGVTVEVGDSSDSDRILSITGTHQGGGDYDEELIKNWIQRSSSFKTITWPSGTWTRIGFGAFAGCSSFNVSSLPSTITTIDQYAFYNCASLTLTELPASVSKIDQYAFYNCSELQLTSLPSGLRIIAYAAFQNCYKIKISELSSSVTQIGNYAFQACTEITSISCDGIITSLAGYAFNGNSSHEMKLERASFPNANVSTLTTTFGASTAANACHFLEFADIGSTLAIGASAFANCYALQTLVLRRSEAICSLGNVSAFLNTPMRGYNGLTGTVYVPSSLISSYQTATNWSTLYNDGTVTFVAIEGSAYELS